MQFTWLIMQRYLKKASSKVSSKLQNQNGFSLIELIIAILISFIVGSAIMDGTLFYRKKMLQYQVKEKAFEELLNYTDFYKSMIFAGRWSNDNLVNWNENAHKVILADFYGECQENSNEDEGCIFGSVDYKIVKGNSEYISEKYYYYKLNTRITWEHAEVKDTLEFEVDQIVNNL